MGRESYRHVQKCVNEFFTRRTFPNPLSRNSPPHRGTRSRALPHSLGQPREFSFRIVAPQGAPAPIKPLTLSAADNYGLLDIRVGDGIASQTQLFALCCTISTTPTGVGGRPRLGKHHSSGIGPSHRVSHSPPSSRPGLRPHQVRSAPRLHGALRLLVEPC